MDPGTREHAAALLGIPVKAGVEEVQTRYRRLARAVHPDKGGSALLFQMVADAQDVMLGRGPPPRPAPKQARSRQQKQPKPKAKQQPKPQHPKPQPPRPKPRPRPYRPHVFGGPSEPQSHMFPGRPQPQAQAQAQAQGMPFPAARPWEPSKDTFAQTFASAPHANFNETFDRPMTTSGVAPGVAPGAFGGLFD